ncbi:MULTISPECIES: amidohydrolase family protein [unclassified Aeromicrobium]|uniref:amidohydrolase family protein n=1 Tax=unclassified Aeromicrobium TaxID=2633570 RepID=UPI00396AF91A
MTALDVVDVHVHYLGPRWRPQVAVASARSGRSRINDLTDVLESARDVAVRVLNAPPALARSADEPLLPSTIAQVNDHLGEVVAAHRDRLAGLATVDLWQGDDAVSEIERVAGLGLSGIVVDAAADGGERLLDDPVVLEPLDAARDLGVPVFVHPIFPQGLTGLLDPLGRPGVLLARGTITAASLVALLVEADRRGTRLPTIITPSLAASAISTAAFARVDASRLHFDTMGFHPGTIAYLVSEVGADRVLVGSDSPIVADDLGADHVLDTLTAAGLDAEQVAAVAGGNARRVLGLPARELV